MKFFLIDYKIQICFVQNKIGGCVYGQDYVLCLVDVDDCIVDVDCGMGLLYFYIYV